MSDWTVTSCILAIILVFVAFGLWVDSEMCAYRFADNGFESKYTITEGCIVRDGSNWVTEREFL